MFRCKLPPALLAEWSGSFTCHCGNMVLEWYRIRVSAQSSLWRRKFSRRDLNSQLFNHESGTLTNKLSRAPTEHTEHRRNGFSFPYSCWHESVLNRDLGVGNDREIHCVKNCVASLIYCVKFVYSVILSIRCLAGGFIWLNDWQNHF